MFSKAPGTGAKVNEFRRTTSSFVTPAEISATYIADPPEFTPTEYLVL